MGRRTKARELALQSLYELEFPEKDLTEVLRSQSDRRGSHKESEEFAARLLERVVAERASLDASIDAQLENWDPQRVNIVLRSILRLALAEGRYFPEQPRSVILDEAVQLARKFDSEDGSRFVNGVLDKLLADEDSAA